MTDETPNLPAVRQEAVPAVMDTDSWAQVAAPILHLAEKIADTEFVPKGLRGSTPKTAAAMLYGREVGLPPMTSLATLDVIEGKPGLSAEGMRMLVLAAGHQLEFMEKTGAQCILRGRRRGSETWHTVVWNIDMARAAGLAGKGVWQKYPRSMLTARATTELCRDIFPDVIHGFRSLEELEDMAGEDTPAEGPGEAPAPRTRVARKSVGKSAKPVVTVEETDQPAPPIRGDDDDRPMGPPLPHEIEHDETCRHDPVEDSAPGGADTPTGEDVAGATDVPPVADLQTPAPEPSTPVAAPVSVPDTPVGGGESPDLVGGDGGNPPPTGPPSGRKRSAAQHRMIMAEWPRLGVDPGDREERLLITGQLVGRTLDSSNDLLHTEASALIDTLGKLRDHDALNAHLDTLEEAQNGDTLL